jgi:ion channel-forming bestrophin family protein
MLLKTKIPFHYVFGKIKYELICILAYSMVVWELYVHVHSTRISIPLSIPAILGTVLSLLLGFRSNQAYDRWWEARHVWGAIVNDSRTFARQVLVFMQTDYASMELEELKRRMVRRQMAWAYSLGQMLRGHDATAGLKKYLSDEDFTAVSGFSNVPAGILMLHARDLQQALNYNFINKFQQIEIDKTISRLCDAQGKCERIKNTVFPSTYGLYIHFSLILFILLLPFGFMDVFGVMAAPVVTAISSCFILIEKMAIHLQDPFENKPTDTPVTAIAKNIERDLKQMLLNEKPEQEYIPVLAEVENPDFYVL